MTGTMCWIRLREDTALHLKHLHAVHMVYAVINSFFEIEVSSNLAKQVLLDAIDSDMQKRNLLMDIEYNVYQLIIKYNDNEVEIWDCIVSPNKEQEPCILSLDAFVQALKGYIPRK